MTDDDEHEARIRLSSKRSLDELLLLRLLDEARAEIAQWRKRFDLFDDAHKRGIKLWQDAHPRNLWPDMAQNVEWLVAEMPDVTLSRRHRERTMVRFCSECSRVH